MRAPWVTEQIAHLTEISNILIANGFKAEVFDSGHEIPSVSVTVTDPYDARITWEFSPSSTEGDPADWMYQIGTYVGDDYEGVVFEYMSHHLTLDSAAEQVANEIRQTIGLGIDAEDLAKIIEAYDHFMEGRAN